MFLIGTARVIQSSPVHVKRQFGEWCRAFKARLASPVKFVVRPYVGDALSFCRMLAGEARQAVAPWDGRLIVADDDHTQAPNTFNVIETSNIADHIGLFNVLTVTIPLLQKSPWSVLHTNTLVPVAGTFIKRIGIDLTTLSLLLGLAPVSLLSHFTTRNNGGAHSPMDNSVQQPQSTAWKYATSGDQATLRDGAVCWEPICIDGDRLSDILFRLYLHIFSNEDMAEHLKKRSPSAIKNSSIILDVRASYAALLKLLKERVATDWPRAMQLLFDKIYQDRSLMVGKNYFQDLCVHAHMLGLHSFGFLSSNLDALGLSIPFHPAIFAKWRNTPAIAYVVLRVPRSAFRKLMELPIREVGTPMLQCELVAPYQFQSAFTSMQITFGEVAMEGEAEDAVAVITRDEAGWQGQAPAIVSFAAPARMLEVDPRNTVVRLALRGTPHSAVFLTGALGMELVLFAAKLVSEGVFVVKDPPRVEGTHNNSHNEGPVHMPDSTSQDAPELDTTRSTSPGTLNTTNAATLLFSEGTESASHISVRVDFTSADARAALAPKSAVVAAQQHSPCTVRLIVGDGEKVSDVVAFPFPIDARDARVRVARKSGYVEVRTRSNPAHPHGGYNLNRMPVVMSHGRTHAWNLSYVNLDMLPALPLEKSDTKQIENWLSPLLTFTFSDRQLALQRSKDKSDTFVNLKSSISVLASFASGMADGNPCRFFALRARSSSSAHTYVLVNAFRLDLASHSILLDVCVLPARKEVASEIMPALQVLMGLHGGMRDILMTDAERDEWKRMLPACVERCRTWEHRPNCAYREQGIPRTLAQFANPICECGQGRDVPESEIIRQCRSMAHLLVRAAIGLAFPVPYLEDVGVTVQKAMQTMERGVEGSACGVCGKGGNAKLLVCARCKRMKYCSKACQTEDWKTHKRLCASIAAGNS
ncbi:hypothetical protein HDZ31DRAFT_31395 [Schizophyllum fasciatum]